MSHRLRLQRPKPSPEAPTPLADKNQALQTAQTMVPPGAADSVPPDVTAQRAVHPIPAPAHDFSRLSILPPGTETPPDLPSTPVQRRGHVTIQTAEPRWDGVRLPLQRARQQEDLGQRIRAAQRGGRPLGSEVQRSLEAGLGAGLSNVRVHTDGEADQLSRSVNAVAFTTGSHIFFRHGTYNPRTPQGMNLLAHEATHTIQQAAGPVAGKPAPGGVSISDPGDPFEQAAERAATESAPPVSAQRAGKGIGARPEAGVSIQRKVALPETHLNDLEDWSGHETMSPADQGRLKEVNRQIRKIAYVYRRYRRATDEPTESEHAAELLDLIGQWFKDSKSGLLPPSVKDRARQRALRTLQLELEMEQLQKLRKGRGGLGPAQSLEAVGIPQSYLQELTPTAHQALTAANAALERGDVATADLRLADLRVEIGAVTNLIKGLLVRHHIGAVHPALAPAMTVPTFEVPADVTAKSLRQAGKARIEEMLLDPNFAGKPGVAPDYATAKQRALAKKAAAPAFGPLTNKEVAFLYHYTSELYSGFNIPLRTEIGTPAFDLGKLAVTQVAISGLNKLPAYTGTCFRHGGIFPGYKELNRTGATVSDLGFMSTAKEQQGCSKGGQNHEVLEIIKVKTGRIVKNIAFFGTGEEEVLVKPGTRFKVDARFDFDDFSSIWNPNLTPDAQTYLNRETKYKDKIKMIVFKSEV